MATKTATPANKTISMNKNSTSGNTTITWTAPSVPAGSTITSCVLTGTATPSATVTDITVGGQSIGASGGSFSVPLGNTVSGSTTATARKARGTATNVVFSGMTYTVTYTDPPSYTVRFLNYNGAVISTQTVIHGEDATEPPNEPYRDGYVFTGWDKPLTNITANTDITAQYSKIWSVTFKDWDGSLITSQNVIEGQDATPPTPTRDGYRFKGWDGSYTNVTENRTLTAQYVEDKPAYIRLPQNTIEVPVGETVPLYVEHNCSDCFVAETNPLESPYITMDPLQGHQITDRINITGVTVGTTTTITIRGFVYEPFSEAGDTIATVHVVAAKPTYTVTFKDWDGSTIDTQTIEEGGNATPPPNPTRDGYRFIGWQGNYKNVFEDTIVTARYELNNIRLGETVVTSLYIGDIPVVKVYYGDNLIYQK